MMDRRAFIAGSIGALLAARAAVAQQDVPRVAYVSRGQPGDFRFRAFLSALAGHGRVNGVNIVVEERGFQDWQKLPAIVRGVVASRPDVVVAHNTPTTIALKDATSDIPIVFAAVNDPVAAGLVSSLERPGGNVTGVSLGVRETNSRRLRLLAELIPGLDRLAILVLNEEVASLPTVGDIAAAAADLGMEPRVVALPGRTEVDRVFGGLRADGVRAMLVVPSRAFNNIAEPLMALAVNHGLAVMYDFPDLVEAGALVSYALNLEAHYARSAYFVDRILGGTEAGELPVEMPAAFDLAINLKTARALGIEIPPKLLSQATELIQ